MGFSLITHEGVQAHNLSWSYSVTAQDTQGKEKKDIITYSVSSDITKIEDEKETIIVDYGNKSLFRYDKRSDKCLEFSITPNSSPPLKPRENVSKEENMLSLSSFRVLPTNKYQFIVNYDCNLKRILFGVDFAKFQMVASPTTDAFGQKFTESIVSYCVSGDVVGFNSLLTIAKQHNDLFESNQFLRQIDIVGLFEILYGFPVQIIKATNNIKTTLSLIDKPQPVNNIVIPKQCQ